MLKIKDHLGLIFISLVTILYLWIVCNLVINLEELKALGLNEKGDFLAGIFSPLAFLWLVFGYYQQGEELKQNTLALNIQAEELKNSVEQQRELVLATKEEIELNKGEIQHQRRIQHIQAQPFFHFKDCFITYDNSRQSFDLMFTFHNSRATCRELQIMVSDKSGNVPETAVLLYPRFDLVLGHNEKNYTLQPQNLPECVKPNNNGAIILELIFKFFDAFDNEQFYIVQFVSLPEEENGKVLIHRVRSEDQKHPTSLNQS